MLNSGDSLLISLFSIIVPAMVILIGTLTYSRTLLRRYSIVLKRLYSLSFKGVDTERKRIARELHDHLGVYSIYLSQHIDSLKTMLEGDELRVLNNLENDYHLFKDKTHQIVEFMYPKGLSNPDWYSSFNQLALQMSMGEVRVSFESHADKYPSDDFLHHTYWAVQEIITNAIKHAKVSRIQISTIDEVGHFSLMIVYAATEQAVAWVNGKTSSKLGFGTVIIEDRLRIIGAKQDIDFRDKVVSHIISIPYENPNT